MTNLTGITAFFDNQASAQTVATLLLNHVNEHQISGLWHPYGFIVFHLGEDLIGNRLRLHLWPDSVRKKQIPEWPIHNHPWPFTSIVLHGCVLQNRHSVVPDHEGTFSLYEVSYHDQISRLTRTGTPVLQSLVGSETLINGRSYQLTRSEYHSVHVSDGKLAATLVRSARASSGAAYVVGDHVGNDLYEFVREPIDRHDADELLQRLAKMAADADPIVTDDREAM